MIWVPQFASLIIADSSNLVDEKLLFLSSANKNIVEEGVVSKIL
jgi:hypothetical protein